MGMKIALMLALALPCFVYAEEEASKESPVPDLSARIVEGSNSRIFNYPYTVSLQDLRRNGNLEHFCAGIIIDQFWILTSARCAGQVRKNRIHVVTGVRVKSGPRMNIVKAVRKVAKIFIHEEFENYDSDIALLKLEEPMKLGKRRFPVVLPNQGVDVPTGTITIATGWGQFNATDPAFSDILQNVELYITSKKYCKDCFGHLLTDNMVCALAPYKDACEGDFGGPLIKKGTSELVGIISWGAGCAEPDYPRVFTRISKFVTWIQDTITS